MKTHHLHNVDRYIQVYRSYITHYQFIITRTQWELLLKTLNYYNVQQNKCFSGMMPNALFIIPQFLRKAKNASSILSMRENVTDDYTVDF